MLNLSSRCLVVVERPFLAVPQGCLRFVIVVFPDHTHLLILMHAQVAPIHHWTNKLLFYQTHRVNL